MKTGLGSRFNNFTELTASRLLLKCAVQKNVRKMQVYGDSSLVINCINVTGQSF